MINLLAYPNPVTTTLSGSVLPVYHSNCFVLPVNYESELNDIPEPESLANTYVYKSSVDVYPNPFDSELHVSLTSNGKAIRRVAIFDANGRVVYDELIDSSSQYSLTGLKKWHSGVYTMHIYAENETYIVKLVKL